MAETVLKPTHSRIMAVMVAAAIAATVQGCAFFCKPKPETDLRAVEKQLETTSAEIEKIYTSIRQTLEILMRHEAIIRELEAVIEAENASPADPGTIGDFPEREITRGRGDDLPFGEEVVAVPRLVTPQNPKNAYDHALTVFYEKKYHAAIPLFDNFATRFPDHDLTDNALYWKGECLYSLGMYAESVRIFQKVATDHPTGNKVPDSFLKIGLARLSLHDTHAAKNYLQKVMGEYPDSPAADKASKTLATLTDET